MKTTILSLATTFALLSATACKEHDDHALLSSGTDLSGGLTDMVDDKALSSSCFQGMGSAQWTQLGLTEEQIQGMRRLQEGVGAARIATDSTASAHASKGSGSASIAGGSDGVEQNTSGYGQLPDSNAGGTQEPKGTQHGLAKSRVGNVDDQTMQELATVLTAEQLVRLKQLCTTGKDPVGH